VKNNDLLLEKAISIAPDEIAGEADLNRAVLERR
jgi:hypothetical protein